MSAWDALLPPCPSGKATYLTAHEAQLALVLIGSRARYRGESRYPQATYECPACRLWHLTSRARTLAEAGGAEASA